MLLELFGWIGGFLLIFSMMQTHILRLRVINLVGSFVLVIFNALVGVWPMVGLNVAMVGINLVQIYRLLAERRSGTAFEVLEVDPKSDFLRHFLRVHEDDIRSFVPGFLWDGAAPDRAAFLVLRRDETIGVVLLHDAGAGVAQVELDYVTPRFRDFAPGKHVYEYSGLFSEHGFYEIVAPTQMRSDDNYLERMGFVEDRGEWRRQVTR